MNENIISLCMSWDETNRMLAAQLLPNEDVNDPFFDWWKKVLPNTKNAPPFSHTSEFYEKALCFAQVFYGKLRVFTALTDEAIAANISEGRFVAPFEDEWWGYFDINGKGLVSLEGCPRKIHGFFDCGRNQIQSLEGGPEEVEGFYSCRFNPLLSLEGAPEYVPRNFDCSYNLLFDIEGAPRVVDGDFICMDNHIYTLKGGPAKVKGNFICINNQLTRIDYRPDVEGGFYSDFGFG